MMNFLPLDSLQPVLSSLPFHHLHPLVVQIHTQHAARDVPQEVLCAKIIRNN